MNIATVLTLHSYQWKISYLSDTDNLGRKWDTIISFCLDRDSNVHVLRVSRYPIYLHVELPERFSNGFRVKWDRALANEIFESLCRMLSRVEDHSPLRYEFSYRDFLYRKQAAKTKIPVLTLWFSSRDAMRHCANILKKGYSLRRNKFEPYVWEYDVDGVKKFLMDIDCGFSQWFQVPASHVTDPALKISRTSREYLALWDTITPIPIESTSSWVTHPGVLCFDIEAYSHRHESFPIATNPYNAAFMVSCIYQRTGIPETRERYLVAIGQLGEIEGTTVINCKDEKEMLLELAKLIDRLEPVVMMGHNILSFDWKYLFDRASVLEFKFPQMGRLKFDDYSRISGDDWSSSGTGFNKIKYIDISGIINVDTLLVTRRDCKLPRYDLDTVAKHFLGRGKHDVKPKEMNEAFYEHKTILELIELSKCSLSPTGTHTNIEPSVISQLNERLKKSSEWMRRVGRYCIEDSELVLDIFEKTNRWVNLVVLSNILEVQISHIYTRGQQIRVVSQIQTRANKLGIIMDKRSQSKFDDWKGAVVFKPELGFHPDVACLDFKSLYPMIIITTNICYTTLVPDWRTDIPDSDCEIVEWKEDPSSETSRTFRFRFIKKEIWEGILPKMCLHLINERDRVRARMRDDPDPVSKMVLDVIQLGLKISANSIFGILGVSEGKGKLTLKEAAMCITAKGRISISKCEQYLIDTWGARTIYGDTDSTFTSKEGVNIYEWAKSIEQELTDLFPKPMKMELEKVGSMFITSKKMYVFWPKDKEGNLLPEKFVDFKGNLVSRREACLWQKSVFKGVVLGIMRGRDLQQTIDLIVELVVPLFNGKVPVKHLELIKGANKRHYKGNVAISIFRDHLESKGKNVEVGDRLSYLIVDRPGKIGDKMEDPEIYVESLSSSEPLSIDFVYYAKLLVNPITKMLISGFGAQIREIEAKNELEDWSRILDDLRANWTGIESPAQLRDLVHGTKDVDSRTKEETLFLKDVSASRRKLVTGKDVFNPRIDSDPIKTLSTAYVKGQLEDAVRALASKETYLKLYPSES